MQRRAAIPLLLATVALAACGRKAPPPPSGELRSALAMPTASGAAFDPGTLTERFTLVTFWSPG